MPSRILFVPDRGVFRGFFVGALAAVALSGCDKPGAVSAPEIRPPSSSRPVSSATQRMDANGQVEAGRGSDAGRDVDGTRPDDGGDEADSSVGLRLPWQAVPRSHDDVIAALPKDPIGTLSGEIFGKDRPVRGVVRADCGAGTVLQAIYENEAGKIQVTPGIAVRFLGLETGKPVEYTDGAFRVEVDFSSDTPDRLEGAIEINYEEGGHSKTYAKLEVDGAPLRTLLPPRIEGEGSLPSFSQCVPNGYMRVVESDGKEHFGLVHATRVADAGGIHVQPLLTENAGLQVVIGLRDAKTEIKKPLELSFAEARTPAPGQDAVVMVQSFWVPELAEPSRASGVNLDGEKSAYVREGRTRLQVRREGREWRLDLRMMDVAIPLLLQGPLRGKKFDVVEIAAWPTAPGVNPTRLAAAPEWWPKSE